MSHRSHERVSCGMCGIASTYHNISLDSLKNNWTKERIKYLYDSFVTTVDQAPIPFAASCQFFMPKLLLYTLHLM